jgi:hypothetical protein
MKYIIISIIKKLTIIGAVAGKGITFVLPRHLQKLFGTKD